MWSATLPSSNLLSSYTGFFGSGVSIKLQIIHGVDMRHNTVGLFLFTHCSCFLLFQILDLLSFTFAVAVAVATAFFAEDLDIRPQD